MEQGFFKQATLADLPIIQSIAYDTFFVTYKAIVSMEQLEWMYDWMYSTESLNKQFETDHTFFLYYQGDEPLGFISVQRTDESVFCFQKIYLHPKAHGKGLGSKLLEKGFEHVATFSVDNPRVELHVNRQNQAVDFYKHHGFKVASQGDYEIHPGYFMNDYIMAIHPQK